MGVFEDQDLLDNSNKSTRPSSSSSYKSVVFKDNRRDGKNLVEMLRAYTRYQRRSRETTKGKPAKLIDDLLKTFAEDKLQGEGSKGNEQEKREQSKSRQNILNSDAKKLKSIIEQEDEHILEESNQHSNNLAKRNSVKYQIAQLKETELSKIQQAEDNDDDSIDLMTLPNKSTPSSISKRPTSAFNPSLGALKKKPTIPHEPSKVLKPTPPLPAKPESDRRKMPPTRQQQTRPAKSISRDPNRGPGVNKSLERMHPVVANKQDSLPTQQIKSDKLTKKTVNEETKFKKSKHSHSMRYPATVKDEDLIAIGNPEDSFDDGNNKKNYKINGGGQTAGVWVKGSKIDEKDKAYSNMTPKLKPIDKNLLKKSASAQKNNFIENNINRRDSLEREYVGSSHPLKNYEKAIEKDLTKALDNPYPMANIVELRMAEDKKRKLPPKSKTIRDSSREGPKAWKGRREAKFPTTTPSLQPATQNEPMFITKQLLPSPLQNYTKENTFKEQYIPSQNHLPPRTHQAKRISATYRKPQKAQTTVLSQKTANMTVAKVTFEDPFSIPDKQVPTYLKNPKSMRPKNGSLSKLRREQRASSLQRMNSLTIEGKGEDFGFAGEPIEIGYFYDDQPSDGYNISVPRQHANTIKNLTGGNWNTPSNYVSSEDIAHQALRNFTNGAAFKNQPSLQVNPTPDIGMFDVAIYTPSFDDSRWQAFDQQSRSPANYRPTDAVRR